MCELCMDVWHVDELCACWVLVYVCMHSCCVCVLCVYCMVGYELCMNCGCGGWHLWHSPIRLLDVGSVTHVVVCLRVLCL